MDEKEPDIRLRAKASDAIVAIEIKVAESWTLRQLEAALVDQLCGQYLRGPEAGYGILLLIHQNTRPVGWRHPETRCMLKFTEVVAHLETLAAEIAGFTTSAAQPVIAILDVAGVGAGAVAT